MSVRGMASLSDDVRYSLVNEECTDHMIDWLGPVMGIALVDLVLSGDNAVVIGAAAAALPPRQRLIAIVVGGGGAIVLRILFALTATMLLQLPYLGVVGGIILLIIAIRLLIQRSTILSHVQENASPEEEQTYPEADICAPKPKSTGFFISIFTILIADVMMSLDNVLAMAGLAQGNLVLLVAGLALSITVLLAGSTLVAILIARLPWLLDIACLIVSWTAANIFLGDDTLLPFFRLFPWMNTVTYVGVLIIVLGIDVYLWKRSKKSGRKLQVQQLEKARWK